MPDSSLPAKPSPPIELTPDAIAAAIKGWPRNAARYINARLADPDRSKVSIIREIGLSDAYPWQWSKDMTLPNGAFIPAVQGLREIDAAITEGRPFLRQELAKDYMTRHSPLIAERTVERALWQDTEDKQLPDGSVQKGVKLTDRRLAVSHQAGMAVLEAAGVIQKAPLVQIDNRRIDVRAMELWQAGGADAWRRRVTARQAPAVPEAPHSEPEA